MQQVMTARGYPSRDDLAARADELSVEHARQLSNLREAHAISEAASAGKATTEDLRQAMVRYRALFADLLRVAPATDEPERLPRPSRSSRSRSSGTDGLGSSR